MSGRRPLTPTWGAMRCYLADGTKVTPRAWTFWMSTWGRRRAVPEDDAGHLDALCLTNGGAGRVSKLVRVPRRYAGFRQTYCTARRYESRVYLVPGCLDDVRLRLRPGALPQDRGASPGFAEAFPRVFPQVSRRRTPPPSCLTH